MDVINEIGKYMMLLDEYMRRQKYDPVPGRFEVFLKIVKYFDALAKKQGGVLDENSILPHGLHGNIQIRFKRLVLKGKALESFAKVIEFSSTFEFCYETTGEVYIEFVFPNIFKLKKQ